MEGIDVHCNDKKCAHLGHADAESIRRVRCPCGYEEWCYRDCMEADRINKCPECGGSWVGFTDQPVSVLMRLQCRPRPD